MLESLEKKAKHSKKKIPDFSLKARKILSVEGSAQQ